MNTVVVTFDDAVLFVLTGSAVALATVAVLVMTVPTGVPGATIEVTLRVAIPPLGSVASVPVTVPFVPATGLVVPLTVPVFVTKVAPANVVPAGKGSVMTTFVAVSGPLFVTVIVLLITSPLILLIFVIDKFAVAAGAIGTMTVACAVLIVFTSCVVLVTVAVLTKTEPAYVVVSTCETIVIVAVAPAVSVAVVPTTVILNSVPVETTVSPPVCVTETRVGPAGKTSVTTTLVASTFPSFVTVIT